jgi:hypothetical protein
VRDKSNGYGAIAEAFTQARRPFIGPKTVLEWASRLQPGAAIIDVGCGNGVPISEAIPIKLQGAPTDLRPNALSIARTAANPVGMSIPWQASAACSGPILRHQTGLTELNSMELK